MEPLKRMKNQHELLGRIESRLAGNQRSMSRIASARSTECDHCARPPFADPRIHDAQRVVRNKVWHSVFSLFADTHAPELAEGRKYRLAGGTRDVRTKSA